MINKQFMAVFGLLVLLAVAIFASANFGLFDTTMTANTNTVENNYNNVVFFRGTNQPGNELLNSDKYISSWQNNGLSTLITINPSAMISSSLNFAGIDKIYFSVYYKESGGAWQKLSSPDGTSTIINKQNPGYVQLPFTFVSTGTWYTMPTYQFNLIGPHVGIIKVELHAKILDWMGLTSSDIIAASDQAYILSGMGSVALESSTSQFQIGDTIKVNVQTGFSGQTIGKSEGWQLRLLNPAGTIINTWNIQDDSEVTITKQVTADMWNNVGSNLYKFSLYNTLISQSACSFVTIDVLSKSPTTPEINLESTSITIGQTINIEISTIVNSSYQSDIYSIDYMIFYGTTMPTYNNDPNWIVGQGTYKIAVPQKNGNTYLIEETIAPSREGTITIKAYAVDSNNRASAISTSSFNVKTDEGNYNITPTENGNTGGNGFIFGLTGENNPLIIGLEILFIVAIVGAIALFVPVSPLIKIIVVVIGGIIIFIII